MSNRYKLSVVIPFYQSEENVPELITALCKLKDELQNTINLEIVVVDDGSTDNGLALLLQSKFALPELKVVKLVGNFGSYPAFLAGLKIASGDCFVQLHADLQDPPKHIPLMVEYWLKGIKLVIGQRVKREDKAFYRFFAAWYHRMVKKIALPHIPDGGYDLILFDRVIRDHVVQMNERNVNLIYLISWLKYPYITIPVTRKQRTKGKSQWSFNRLIKHVFDTIVAFSYLPIRMVTMSAILNLILWASITLFMFIKSPKITFFEWLIYTAITGIFCSLSVIAEYLWRTLEASRKRPSYFIEEIYP